MQPTGNKDPITGKDEYLAPDGVSKVYATPDEVEQLKVMSAGGPQKMPDSAFVQPGRLGNFGIVPITETPPPVTKAMAAPAPAPAVPMATGPIVDDSEPVARSTPPQQPQLPAMPGPTIDRLEDSTRTRQVVTPELAKKEDEASKAMATAITKESEANAAIADAQAQSAMATAAREKQFVEAEQVKQAKEQAMIAERQAKLDAISDEYADMKIDSNNFWAKKSTGDSILAALAIGLGAMSDVANGGKSQTLQILQSKIDQDIEIQKANMAQAGRSLENQRGLYSDILRQTGDERIARLKTHELGLNATKAEFAALAAKSGNDLVKAKALKDIAALDQALVQNKIAQNGTLATSAKDVVTPAAKATTIEVPSTIGTPLRDAATKVNIWSNLEKEMSSISKARLEEIAGPIDQAQQDIYKRLGWEIPADAAQLRAETDIARFKFVKAMTGAGVNVQELQQYKDILPNLQNNPATAMSIIKGLKSSARQELKQLIDTETKLNPQYAPNIMNAYGSYIFDTEDKKSKYGAKSISK